MAMPIGDPEIRRFLHDIRNPIGALVGFTHVLKNRGAKLSEEQREQVVDSMFRTSERLSKMVEDFASAHRAQTKDGHSS